MSSAPIALVGSGEYLPVMAKIEGDLIAGRPPKYVQLATAAAPEGDSSLAFWHKLGKEQAVRLGVEQVIVDVRNREDANNPELAALFEGAGLIYLSGGNPAFLSNTLRDTLVWEAIKAAHRAGSALAGCSAGAMTLSEWAPRPRDFNSEHISGLGYVPHIRVIPHFDKFGSWIPDMLRNTMLKLPDGVMLLGIDEETALVGGPHEWVVQGNQSVWHLGDGKRVEYPSGSTLITP